MTQKELSYVEDAIGHEKNIIAIMEDSLDKVEDENIKSFLEKELKGHSSMQEKLMELLEDNANE